MKLSAPGKGGKILIDKSGFLPFGFLKAGGVQSGDHKGMRYRMIRKKGGEGEEDQLLAWVWSEPFAFDTTPEEEKTMAAFPFTEEGRLSAIGWIGSQYEERKEKWESAPSLLSAFKMK